MKFTIGSVLGSCFATMGAAFWPLLAITAIYYLSVSIIGALLVVALGQIQNPGVKGIVVFLPMLITYPMWSAHWCAVTEVALRRAANKPIQIGAVMRNSVANAFPVLLIGLLWLLGALVGWALFVIPGTIFIIVFQVTVPAYIEEKPGIFGAFSRSRVLTRGHRWGIFGFNLLVNVSLYVISVVGLVGIGLLAGMTGSGPNSAFEYVVLAITMLVFTPAIFVFIPTLNATVYAALRAEKREPLTGSIEKIFE